MGVEDIAALQENRALEVLIQLSKTPGILRTVLYEKIMANGAGKQTVIKRTDELIIAGLIYTVQSKTHKAGQYLFLTDKGQKIAKHALKMEDIMSGESNAGDDSDDMDYSTSTNIDAVAALELKKK